MGGLIPLAAAGVILGGVGTWAQRRRRRYHALTTQLADAQSEVTHLATELSVSQTRQDATANTLAGVLILDQLDVIDGLTPHHARLFNAAGILTYADLARLTAERIVILIAETGGARLDVTRWIEEAAQLAEADPLPKWYGEQSA